MKSKNFRNLFLYVLAIFFVFSLFSFVDVKTTHAVTYGAWSNWGSCGNGTFPACGSGGTQTRTRSCIVGPCPVSQLSQKRNCSLPACKINGGWSSWSPVNSSCGITYTQTRTCTNPSPANGGANCSGNSSQSVTNPPCPQNGSCAGNHYNCELGESYAVSDNSSNWTWSCKGQNGGNPVNCSETKPSANGSFSISPSSNVPYGSQSTMSWSASGVGTTCTATSGPWSTGGAKSGSGLWTDPLTSNTTFGISCSGPNVQSYSASVSVTVAPANYTITFNSNGGSVVNSITQAVGTTVSAPTSPTRSGYAFAGWSLNFPLSMPSGGATANANWSANGCTSPFGGTIASGNSITAYQSSTSNICVSESRTCTNGVLSGNWTNISCSVNKYDITFNTNGGSVVNKITQAYGTLIPVPANPTKLGYTFVSWSPALATYMPSGGQTLNANWTLNSYPITWNIATGGKSSGSPSCFFGTSVVVTCTPDAGYSSSCTSSFTCGTSNSFTPSFTLNKHTLSTTKLGTGFGAVNGTGLYNYGTPVTLTVTPSLDSTFSGWGGACDSSGKVTMTSDKTCTATFTKLLAPTVSVSALSQSIPYGGNTTISWTSTGATSCSSEGGGGSGSTGSFNTGALTTSKQYTVYCNNIIKTVSDSVTVTVTGKPTGNITTDQSSCTIAAGSSTCNIKFSWNTTTPIGVSAITSPSFSGNVFSGNTGNYQSHSIPRGSSTYYLHNGGYQLDQKTVSSDCAFGTMWNFGSQTCVTPPPPLVDIKAQNSDGPITVKASGNTVPGSLRWTMDNVSSCTASGNWAPRENLIAYQGTTFSIDYFLNPANILNHSYIFTITCTNSVGVSASDSVRVVVVGPVSLRVGPVEQDYVGGGPLSPQTFVLLTGIDQNEFTTSSDNKTFKFYCTQQEYNANTPRKTVVSSDGFESYSCGVGLPGSYTAWFKIERDSGYGAGLVTASASANYSVYPINFQSLITANNTSGSITIPYNTSATLNWDYSGDSFGYTCSASSTPAGWTGSKPVTGSEPTGNLTASKTYRITCVNPIGRSEFDEVTVNVTQVPNLVASTPTPLTATTNTAQKYTSTISNIGPVSTGSPFNYFFQTNNSYNGTGGTTIGHAYSSMLALSAGSSATATSSSITFSSTGTYSIRACADKSNSTSSGSITESNDNDNCSAWVNVEVKNEIIMSGTLGPLSNPCTIPQGGSSCSVNLNWSIANHESAFSAITANGMSDRNYSGVYSGNDSFSVPYPSRTFYLYNNGKSLVPNSPNGSGVTVNTMCESGTVWNTTYNRCKAPDVVVNGICATTHYDCSLGTTTGSTGDTATAWKWACNGSGVGHTNATCSENKPITPTVSISASPNPVAYGAKSTLVWSSTNAQSCTTSSNWSNGGKLSSSGLTDALTTNTTFTYQCTGSTGLTSPVASVTVNVGSAPVVTTGTLTSSASSCDITDGNDKCYNPPLITWKTNNPPTGATSAVTANASPYTPAVNEVGNSNSKYFPIPYGGRTFYLYNNNVELDNISITAKCIPGSGFDSVTKKCKAGTISNDPNTPPPTEPPADTPPPPDQTPGDMSGTLTPASSSCTISAGSSTCSINFSWTTTNPSNTSVITKPTNTTVANGNTGSSVPLTVKYNFETFYLYNSGTELAHSNVFSSCSSDSFWNGSICEVSATPPPSDDDDEVSLPPNNHPNLDFGPDGSDGSTDGSTSIYGGDSVTLVWASSAASCTSPDFETAEASSGSVVVNPTSTTTYTIICGSETGHWTIMVKKRPVFIEN